MHASVRKEEIPDPADLLPALLHGTTRTEEIPDASDLSPTGLHGSVRTEEVPDIIDLPPAGLHGSVRAKIIPFACVLHPAGPHHTAFIQEVPFSAVLHPAGLRGSSPVEIPGTILLFPARLIRTRLTGLLTGLSSGLSVVIRTRNDPVYVVSRGSSVICLLRGRRCHGGVVLHTPDRCKCMSDGGISDITGLPSRRTRIRIVYDRSVKKLLHGDGRMQPMHARRIRCLHVLCVNDDVTGLDLSCIYIPDHPVRGFLIAGLSALQTCHELEFRTFGHGLIQFLNSASDHKISYQS